MSLRQHAYRGSAMLTMSQIVVYGSSFVRNMLLARLLTKADFGTAAAFGMVIQLLEFSTSLGISRFVIRDKDGGQPEFIAAAHLMQCATGVLSALLIAGGAWPLAALFGLEDHRWAMVVLAIVPVLNGFQHLDVRRFERDLRFGPSALVEMIPQIAITLAAWPVAWWLGDFRAMLVLLMAKAFASCVASHALAEQPYRWRADTGHIMRMLRFGWPLLINGFLMFGALQGDQFLVATFYTMADLGPYAAAAALTMAPTFFFGRVFTSVMLPVMAKVQDNPAEFRRRYCQATAILCAFAAVCAAGLIVGSEGIMQLVYGPKYAGAGAILACLATANAFRNTRVACALAALAKGDSQNQMISSVWRVVALGPALVIAMWHQPVWMIACAGFVGEFLAGRASMIRLRRRDGVPLAMGLIPTVWVAVVTALALLASWRIHHWSPWMAVAAAAAAAAAAGMVVVLAFPVLREEVAALWSRWRVHGWRGLRMEA